MTKYQYDVSMKSPYSHTNYSGETMKWTSVDIGAILASARAVPKPMEKREKDLAEE